MDDNNIPFSFKVVVLIIPALIVWAISFGIAFLLNREQWLVSLIITFLVTVGSTYAVTTFKGSDDYIDMP